MPLSDPSPRLTLPFIQPSQAQKHVTHNEALQRLDALTQLRVVQFDATSPPVTPETGETHALGTSPSGAWSGQGGALAYWNGGAWLFIAPQDGWRAWGAQEQELRVYTNDAWAGISGGAGAATLGVNTSADAVNRLAVSSQAALFTHEGAGHQIKVNKASGADTASLLFQSNFTGHAEMGLAGDNAFSVKVSADGSAWHSALRASSTELRVDLPLTGAGAAGRTGPMIALGAGDDLDGITDSGYYYNPAPGNTAFNHYPVGGTGFLVVRGQDANRAVQTYYSEAGTGAQAHTYTRTRDGAGWSDWTSPYPETGSNANGTYTRFPDGTQICFETGPAVAIDIAIGSIWRSDATSNWTFPAAFITPPCISGTAGDSVAWLGAFDPSTTNVSYRLMSAVSRTDAKTPTLTAMGRWK